METKDQMVKRLEGEFRLREIGRVCELALEEQRSRGSNEIGRKVVRFAGSHGRTNRGYLSIRCHPTEDKIGYSSFPGFLSSSSDR